MNFDELVRLSTEAGLSDVHVDTYCTRFSMSRAAFYDAFARVIAHRFAQGRLSYEQGDEGMNRLIAFANYEVPQYAWSVFLAFDEGEYYHHGDSHDIDPVEQYTKPALSAIIAAENSA